MVFILHVSYRATVERGLEDVEKVLVSVAKRLDEGGYPSDQASTPHFQELDSYSFRSFSWVSNSSK